MNDYRVIESTSLDGLEKRVIEHLNQGWTLAGGIFVDTSFSSGMRFYYQAMVYKPF